MAAPDKGKRKVRVIAPMFDLIASGKFKQFLSSLLQYIALQLCNIVAIWHPV
jgi:hypothetical protein